LLQVILFLQDFQYFQAIHLLQVILQDQKHQRILWVLDFPTLLEDPLLLLVPFHPLDLQLQDCRGLLSIHLVQQHLGRLGILQVQMLRQFLFDQVHQVIQVYQLVQYFQETH
jgi:hypothetical protein